MRTTHLDELMHIKSDGCSIVRFATNDGRLVSENVMLILVVYKHELLAGKVNGSTVSAAAMKHHWPICFTRHDDIFRTKLQS